MHVAYTCVSTTSCKSGSKRVIYYSLSAHAHFQNDHENWSGQNRTSRTACYGHVFPIEPMQVLEVGHTTKGALQYHSTVMV